MPTPDDDSGSDREDELPQVVVLKGGDMTAEEVKKIKDEIRTDAEAEKGEAFSLNLVWCPFYHLKCTSFCFLVSEREAPIFTHVHALESCTSFLCAGDEPPPDGKILFKKPTKRSSTEKFQGITASSSKMKKNDGKKEEQKEVKSGKKVKNNSLLSFGGDEEEEDD